MSSDIPKEGRSQEIIIGCVGKPSSGKTSFLRAVCENNEKAKIGNYPFTTIEPNRSIAMYQFPCICSQYKSLFPYVTDRQGSICSPVYGNCVNGTRTLPIQILDVAGLIPGASQGAGLGNKFLDDLRHAHVFLHVVDASGRTNAQGQPTRGHDPVEDVFWLHEEIRAWISTNIQTKLPRLVRKQTSTKTRFDRLIQTLFAGYSTKLSTTQKVLELCDKSSLSGKFNPNSDISKLDKDDIELLVESFLQVRFPTVIVANKVDCKPAAKNIEQLFARARFFGKSYYKPDLVVPASALAELFLRKLHKQQLIFYKPGSDTFETKEDVHQQQSSNSDQKDADTLSALLGLTSSSSSSSNNENKNSSDDDRARKQQLKPITNKQQRDTLQKLKDLVLYRYSSTGVQVAIQRAVKTLGFIRVYPVKHNLNILAKAHQQDTHHSLTLFPHCLLVEPGTSVKKIAQLMNCGKVVTHAEDENGQRKGLDFAITKNNTIIKLVLDRRIGD